MAVDPRISLLGNVPYVPPPDFGQTMLQAAVLQQYQQQAQQRSATLAEMLEARKRGLAVQQYWDRFRQGQGQAPSAPATPNLAPSPTAPRMADLVPPAGAGGYVQNPARSPSYGYDQLTPGTQAFPGTTFTSA